MFGGAKLRRIERSKDVLLLTLIVASLIAPILTMSPLSVSPVSASPGSAEIVVRAKNTAYNIDQRGNKPWFNYLVGDRPVLMVANRVGSGGIFVATASTCRNSRWNATDNPYPHYDVLLDVAFQWMKPGATQVLWYGGHNVYNDRSVCSQLVSALENLGYTIRGATTNPITPDLLALYDILVIPQMQEGNAGTGGDSTKISDAEAQTIRSFVENGHGLVVMEASDFSGYNFNFVQNKVLNNMTDGYFFQDDQVSDSSNYWGAGSAYYNVIADVDTTTAIGAAYENRTGGTGIGLYSVCSMAKAGPGVSMFVLPDYQVGMPGTTLRYTVKVYNPSNPLAVDLTYLLTVEDTKGWAPSLENSSLFVPVGENRRTYLTVAIPYNTTICTEDSITVNAVADGYPSVKSSITCTAHAGLRIEPTDDTYVSDQEVTANYNSENSLRIGRYNEYWQWDYLKFDFSNIPSGISPESITDARLCLFAYYTYSGGFNVRCDSVDDDAWTETGITWNTKPTPGTTLDTKFVNAASYESPVSYFWDVTSFVKQELAGDKLASFCMLPPDNLGSSISRAFWPKDGYENRTRPFLMIAYTSQIAPRVSVSISPSHSGGLPGSSLSYTVTVNNEGGVSDTYSLTTADNASWSRTISPTSLPLAAGASGTATLTVAIPSGADIGTSDNVRVTATGTSASASTSCIAQASAGGATSLTIFPSKFALYPGYSGQVQSLVATLRDGNNPLPNKTITWSATSGSVNPSSGTTDASGQVSVVYTAPTVTAETSQVTIAASFAGDNQYLASSATSSGIPAVPVRENISASTGGTVVVNVIEINITVNVLIVPPNALSENTTITVVRAPPENLSSYAMVSCIFDIGPSGTTFTTPSTLTLPYNENEIPPGVSEETLAIYCHTGNNWERLGGTVDKTANTVSIQIDHLSEYAVMTSVGGGVQVTISPASNSGNPGERLEFSVTFTNTGTATDTFDLNAEDTKGWGPTLAVTPPRITLAGGASRTIGLSITIPSTAAAGDSTTITVTAAGTGATCTATAQAGGGISPFVYVGAVVVIVAIIAAVIVIKPF